MALVSIIVPIYNAEKYLRMCIESIRMQQMSDFELLLVNDGSRDGSLDICKEYAAKDNRIKVLDKPNGGVSSARNLGLDSATGEYIMFVDADDWLVPNALSVCMPYIPEYDIVKYGAVAYMADGTFYNISTKNPKDKYDAMGLVISRSTIVAPWGMLARRTIFCENNIRFDHDIKVGEDWLVVAQVMNCARNFKFLPDVYSYSYNKINDGSCTNNMTLDKRAQQYDVLSRIKNFVGGGYSSHFRYTKAVLTIELKNAMNGEDRSILVRWFKEPANRKYLMSLKDILLAKVSLGKKNRLLQLWMEVNI